MKPQGIIKLASLLAVTAVIFGAFGAHALREKIDAHSLEIWETATRYQFYHVFALFIIAMLQMKKNIPVLIIGARLFSFGILFFCGSLYLIALQSFFSISLLWLGPFTPIGGLFFIGGWICLFKGAGDFNENINS